MRENGCECGGTLPVGGFYMGLETRQHDCGVGAERRLPWKKPGYNESVWKLTSVAGAVAKCAAALTP